MSKSLTQQSINRYHFGCVFSSPGYIDTMWEFQHYLPGDKKWMHACHFFQKILLTSPGSKQCYLPNLSRKKSNSVCYHAVHESVAMGESLVGHIPCIENVADLMTKVLHGQKRISLIINIFYDIHDDQ